MGKGILLMHPFKHDNDKNINNDQSFIVILAAISFLIIRFIYLYCSCTCNNKLKHNRYKKIIFDEEKEYYDSCTICLDDFDNNEKLLKLKCNHIYHEKCIKIWFKNKSNCPNCNSSFSSDDNISPISIV